MDNWVPTRPIWNQHSYHVTNVEVNGVVPLREDPSWISSNTYRTNAQGRLPNCAPDLVVAQLDVDRRECPELVVTVRVRKLRLPRRGSGSRSQLLRGAGPPGFGADRGTHAAGSCGEAPVSSICAVDRHAAVLRAQQFGHRSCRVRLVSSSAATDASRSFACGSEPS